MEDNEHQMLKLMAQSIVSGTTASMPSMYLTTGPAGRAIRRHINATIPGLQATLLMLCASRQNDDEETLKGSQEASVVWSQSRPNGQRHPFDRIGSCCRFQQATIVAVAS